MATDAAELDQLPNAFKSSVEQWIARIREEEAVASTEHSAADIDRWEEAAFRQKAGDEVKAAKKRYEDALRREFF